MRPDASTELSVCSSRRSAMAARRERKPKSDTAPKPKKAAAKKPKAKKKPPPKKKKKASAAATTDTGDVVVPQRARCARLCGKLPCGKLFCCSAPKADEMLDDEDRKLFTIKVYDKVLELISRNGKNLVGSKCAMIVGSKKKVNYFSRKLQAC